MFLCLFYVIIECINLFSFSISIYLSNLSNDICFSNANMNFQKSANLDNTLEILNMYVLSLDSFQYIAYIT